MYMFFKLSSALFITDLVLGDLDFILGDEDLMSVCIYLFWLRYMGVLGCARRFLIFTSLNLLKVSPFDCERGVWLSS